MSHKELPLHAGVARRRRGQSLRCALLVGVSFAGWSAHIGAASAANVVAGFDANQLARNDDSSTGAVTLPFQANFFGTTYSQLYVNNNGNVTFGSASSAFTPTGLGTGYRGVPIIAPFFTDIDTRNPASGVVTYGNGTYAGQTAFGVTWPSVGFYNSRADLTNTFQLVLTNRVDTGAGNFDIYFNYDRIQFETGEADGGVNGRGGTSASAGFSAGTGAAGTFFQIPGSLVNGAFLDGGPNALVTSTNDGVPGQFLFPVRNGTVLMASVCSSGDNASTTAVANCGPNQAYNTGIFYTPTVNFTLNVLDNTTITGPGTTDAVLVMPASTTGALTTNNVTVNVSASATITSANRAGIYVDGSGGVGAVQVTTAGRITAGTAGVLAQTGGTLGATNTGTITAPFGILGAGAVASIVNGGQIGGATIGAAVSTTSSARVANSGSVTFGLAGLAAFTGGAAVQTTIDNTGTLTRNASLPTSASSTVVANLPTFAAGINQAIAAAASMFGSGSSAPVGIAAFAQSGVLTISNAGTIDAGATGVAIAASLQGSNIGAATVTNSGTLSGASGIIGVVSGSGGSLTINNAATGRIVSGSGFAIDTRASTVATQVVNSGGILGAVALSNGSSFGNGGQFVTGGTSAFGGGAFGTTGTVSLASGSAGSAVSATLGGVGTFTNAGTIDLRTGSAANTLTIGGNYVGNNGSLLLQASTQAGTSDRLVITALHLSSS